MYVCVYMNEYIYIYNIYLYAEETYWSMHLNIFINIFLSVFLIFTCIKWLLSELYAYYPWWSQRLSGKKYNLHFTGDEIEAPRDYTVCPSWHTESESVCLPSHHTSNSEAVSPSLGPTWEWDTDRCKRPSLANGSLHSVLTNYKQLKVPLKRQAHL